MARIEVKEWVNSPGTPGRTGDDRFGFDAAAGTAWVLDGATDVTPLKPFPQAESGAAWFAETLSQRLLVAPAPDMAAADYWHDVIADVRQRAVRDSVLPLGTLPPEASPIASGVWFRRSGTETAEIGWVGDCFVLDMAAGKFIGHTAAVADETADAQRDIDAGLSQEARWEAARQSRIATNTGNKPIFGLDPARASHLSLTSLTVAAGDDFVMMTDGFYRLVEPYRVVTGGADLADLIRRGGLARAIERLRDHEADTTNAGTPQLKPCDDASALWIEIT